MTEQAGLCLTWSEPKLLVFSPTGSYDLTLIVIGDDSAFSSHTTEATTMDRLGSHLRSIVRKSRSSLGSTDSHETLKGSMSKSSIVRIGSTDSHDSMCKSSNIRIGSTYSHKTLKVSMSKSNIIRIGSTCTYSHETLKGSMSKSSIITIGRTSSHETL